MKTLSTRRLVSAAAVVAGVLLPSLITGQSAAAASTAPPAAVTASAAGANELTCKTEPNRYTICFSITDITNGPHFTVHIGIDVAMSQQAAQDIINAPGEEFSAKLYGDDPLFDNAVKSIWVTSSWAWEGGLSAEFDVGILAEQLDEDSDGGTDELYGLVKLYVPDSGVTRTFQTNNIEDSFQLYR